MDDEWDLQAVVKGCAAAMTTTTGSTTTAAATTNNSFPSLPSLSFHDDQNSSFDFSGFIYDGDNNDFQGLQEIYQEFCLDEWPPAAATSAANNSATGLMSIPVANVFQPHQEIVQTQPPLQMNMQIQEHAQFNNPMLGSSPQNFPATIPQPIRPRRRKNQQVKMVRQMTQEELSADSWAWRKYGQKPIKGSPYPRNYYRCSTSKGCAARKQVERSPNDAGIFVVSYTGEHTHPRPSQRSLLAGSTRSKFTSSPVVAAGNNINNNALLFQKGPISSSSPASGSSSSPTTPSMGVEAAALNDDIEMTEEDDGAGDDDDDNIFMISNVLLNDDDDDMISSGFLSSSPWWPTGSAGNATGGGGV